MTISKESSNASRATDRTAGVVAALLLLLGLSGLGAAPALAEVRLLEGQYDPEIAARGFTGIAECSDIACLDLNPALLHSEDEKVRLAESIGTRFNEALFNTVDKWQQTKEAFSSDRYREILLKTWNFASRQTAKAEVDLGLRLKSFGLSYAPANFGAVLFAHDPVLPFGELYNYSFSSLRAGYAFWLPVAPAGFRSLTIGAAVKYVSATSNRFVFDQFNQDYHQVERVDGQWARGRLGLHAELATARRLSLSAVISGIPIYGAPLANMPNTDYFDVQPGAAIELARFWWGDLRGYYSLSRLTRDESPWLKQHAGIEGTVGRFKTSIGISDAMLTYGMSIMLPLFKFSVATYAVEYTGLVHNVTDRIYWFKLEI